MKPSFSMPSPRRFAPAALGGALALGLAAAGAGPSAASEGQALFYSVDDPRLEWAACPPFLPQGCGLAVLQGDPAKENADIFFRVPGNTKLPRHWHTSAERMILISGELHLTYDGQETEVMRPGSYAYGPAELPHEGFCAEGDPCVLFIAFEQPVDAVPIDGSN